MSTTEVMVITIVMAFDLMMVAQGQSLEFATAAAVAVITATTRSLRVLRGGTIRSNG